MKNVQLAKNANKDIDQITQHLDLRYLKPDSNF